jgi:predicted dehydrogenase
MAVFGSGHGFSTLIPAAIITDLYEIYAARSRFPKIIVDLPGNNRVQEESRENLFQNFILDLAVIAVPPNEQLVLTRGLISNSKNIYLEKPAGLNSAEAKELEALAVDFNRNIFVGYQFRFDPAIQFFKNLIQNSNSVSKLSINWHTTGEGSKNSFFNWRDNPAKGGGVRTNFLVHVIDYLIYLFGQDLFKNQSQWKVLEYDLNTLAILCTGAVEIDIKISRGKVRNSYWEFVLFYLDNKIFINNKLINCDSVITFFTFIIVPCFICYTTK